MKATKFLSMAAFAAVALTTVFTSCKDDPDPVPVITIGTQPAATTTVTEGAITGSLTVVATVTEGATLSYQWYSNTTAANTGGTKIESATSTSYTIPTDLVAGTYYYFCEVTAEGATAVRSNAATVTVSAAPVPVITIGTQPTAPAELTAGSIAADTKLTVAATVTEEATPSYQWYTNTTASAEGGTAIEDATEASYTIPTDLAIGEHFYFCEVSAEGATAVRSDAVTVTVKAAGLSVITIATQPTAPAELTEGSIEADTKLTVEATVTGEATLSYQWYTNTTASNEGGTAIEGATEASYTLPTDLKAGTFYYFCEVGATNENAVRSDAVTVTVKAAPVPVITIGTQPTAPAELTAGSIPADTKLAVVATATEEAALSYQWYSNETASNEGGAAIEGATEASYTIPTDLAAGEYFYFCEVSAEGATAVRSNAVTVKVAAEEEEEPEA